MKCSICHIDPDTITSGRCACPEELPQRPAQIKQTIRNVLRLHPNLDEVDIADKINLPLPFVCVLCDELLKEGKIKRVLINDLKEGVRDEQR